MVFPRFLYCLANVTTSSVVRVIFRWKKKYTNALFTNTQFEVQLTVILIRMMSSLLLDSDFQHAHCEVSFYNFQRVFNSF